MLTYRAQGWAGDSFKHPPCDPTRDKTSRKKCCLYIYEDLIEYDSLDFLKFAQQILLILFLPIKILESKTNTSRNPPVCAVLLHNSLTVDPNEKSNVSTMYVDLLCQISN